MKKNTIFSLITFTFYQLVCMSDYEKECFMVQGFSSATGSTPATTGTSHSEFVQDAQQGSLINVFSKIFRVDIIVICRRHR